MTDHDSDFISDSDVEEFSSFSDDEPTVEIPDFPVEPISHTNTTALNGNSTQTCQHCQTRTIQQTIPDFNYQDSLCTIL